MEGGRSILSYLLNYGKEQCQMAMLGWQAAGEGKDSGLFLENIDDTVQLR